LAVSNLTKIGCWCYRVEMEDRASSRGLRPEANPQLEAHLRGCEECREALDDAVLANVLLRDAEAPVIEPSNQFSMRVMASIREELSRRNSPDVIWRPLEILASRFAVAAAAVLFIVSLYLAEFAPPFRPAPTNAQAEVGAVMPEPPAQPSNPDEVLASLAAGEEQ
jgi:hypothetical protein